MGKSQITALPLEGGERAEFVATASRAFETVLDRLDLENPEPVRRLWNAEEYVDEGLLAEHMLPIDRDYALSLIDAFLVHYVLGLATRAEVA